MIANYAEVKVSRTDGRSWDLVTIERGLTAATNARSIARDMTTRPAMDYVEVVLEVRQGANTTESHTYRWSRVSGWATIC